MRTTSQAQGKKVTKESLRKSVSSPTKAKEPEAKAELLAQALELTLAADRAMRQVHELVKENSLGDKTLQSTSLEATDKVSSMRVELIAATDGRPAPFVLTWYLGHPVSDDNFLRWGQVGGFSKEFPNDPAAYLGDSEFELEHLSQLRDWIDAVIAWHGR